MDACTSAKEVAACVRDKPITSPKMYHNRLTPTGSDVMSRWMRVFTLCQNHWRTFVCSLMMLIVYLELLVYPYVTPVQVRPRKVPVLQHAKLACYSMEQDDEVKVTFSQQDNVKDKLDTLKKTDSVDGGSSWSLPPNAGDLTCMVFTLCQNHWRQFFCSLMMLIA